jgi:glycosyltransferase A (GT-A) superfamily protein (DUF2064 family)
MGVRALGATVENNGFGSCGEEVLLVFLRTPGSPGSDGCSCRTSVRILAVARTLDRPDCTRIAYHGPLSRPAEISTWTAADFRAVPQPDADLGGRLEHAFVRAFKNGARRVVAVCGECGDITTEILAEAFDALRRTDAAVGPALDGGFYLLGLSRPCHRVFRGVPWSSDRALRVALAQLRSCGLGVRILPPLRDLAEL